MNGKDYVNRAIESAEKVVAEIRNDGLLESDLILNSVAEACKHLGTVKNKATLRTRTGTNLAFPVHDAAQGLEEAWQEAQERNDLDELKESMEDFINRVEELIAALKERTVIMT